MKQILIGYPKRDGSGTPEIICGLETALAKLAEIMRSADRDHVFPEGIERLERVNLETVQTSVFISAEVTAHLKERRENEANLIKEKKEKVATLSATQKQIAETAATLRLAVITRNNLLGDKLKADVRLRNLINTPLELCGKNHQAETEKAQKEVATLETKVATAVAAYQKAADAHQAAKNPAPVTGALASGPASSEPANEFKVKAEAELNKATLDELRSLVEYLNKGVPTTYQAGGFTITPRQQIQQFQETATDKMLIAAILDNCDFTAAKPI